MRGIMVNILLVPQQVQTMVRRIHYGNALFVGFLKKSKDGYVADHLQRRLSVCVTLYTCI